MKSCGFSWVLRQTSYRSVVVIPILAIVALLIMPKLAHAQFTDAQPPQEKSSPPQRNDQQPNSQQPNDLNRNNAPSSALQHGTRGAGSTNLTHGELAQFVPQPEPSDPNAPVPSTGLEGGRYL